MGILALIAGSAAGIIVIAVTFIGVGHLTHLPNSTHPWLLRAATILMYGAGCLLAVTGVGVIVSGIAARVAGLFGGLGAGIPHMVLVITSVILILGLVVGLWKAPTAQVAITAALVPLVLMLTSYGAIHQFFVATAAPAQAFASQFNVWLGG